MRLDSGVRLGNNQILEHSIQFADVDLELGARFLVETDDLDGVLRDAFDSVGGIRRLEVRFVGPRIWMKPMCYPCHVSTKP